MKDFEIISHTADLQIQAFGKNEKELFTNALIGMFQSIKPINENCKYENERIVCPNLPIEHNIKINSSELELLLVDFLSEALYLSDVNNEAYLNVKIHEITPEYIDATLQGIKIDRFEVCEIKAVTYHDLKIIHENNLYKTNIVFDI